MFDPSFALVLIPCLIPLLYLTGSILEALVETNNVPSMPNLLECIITSLGIFFGVTVIYNQNKSDATIQLLRIIDTKINQGTSKTHVDGVVSDLQSYCNKMVDDSRNDLVKRLEANYATLDERLKTLEQQQRTDTSNSIVSTRTDELQQIRRELQKETERCQNAEKKAAEYKQMYKDNIERMDRDLQEEISKRREAEEEIGNVIESLTSQLTSHLLKPIAAIDMDNGRPDGSQSGRTTRA